jgi:hypothetical protein
MVVYVTRRFADDDVEDEKSDSIGYEILISLIFRSSCSAWWVSHDAITWNSLLPKVYR